MEGRNCGPVHATETYIRPERKYNMIIAVDFDGILCQNRFPEIGPPNYEVISLVRELMDRGHEVVLWTTRNGDELKEAVEWCEDRELHFCAVNFPAPSNAAEYADKYPVQSRKIYADIYIDDHNLEFVSNDNDGHPRDGTSNTIKLIRRILKNEQG